MRLCVRLSASAPAHPRQLPLPLPQGTVHRCSAVGLQWPAVGAGRVSPARGCRLSARGWSLSKPPRRGLRLELRLAPALPKKPSPPPPSPLFSPLSQYPELLSIVKCGFSFRSSTISMLHFPTQRSLASQHINAAENLFSPINLFGPPLSS